MSQEERSEALIGVLEDLQESDIGFVLVGGYAVSQFETRFSTDLDLVIAPEGYVIAGEKATPLRAGMNRRHRLLSVRGEALGALHAFL